MDDKDFLKQAKKYSQPFCVTNGKKFRLKDVDPGDTRDFDSDEKPQAQEALAAGVEALAELQDKLYAQDRWSVLLIFQAMDAAGKDGAIKHVMSGINPQGCQVYSFKAPSAEELDHDYLWRCAKRLPERGRIGIFNRSYYEEVLVVRVHPEFLDGQKLPAESSTKDIWDERFRGHPHFERYLTRNGIAGPASSSSTFRRTNRRNASSSASTTRRRTGNSPLNDVASASTGTTTWTPTSERSARPHRSTRRGTSSRLTTSGSRAWSSQRRSSST